VARAPPRALPAIEEFEEAGRPRGNVFHLAAYLTILTLARFLAALPLGTALAFGRGLGFLCFHVVRLRRGVVLGNLRYVFGATMTEAEIVAVAGRAYGEFAMTLVEVLRSSGSAAADLKANVEIAGGLAPFEALKAAGTPMIFCQPHAGNFDLAAYAFAALGFPTHTIMRPIKNRRLNDWIRKTRERHGIIVHFKARESLGDFTELLRAGGWAGLLPDQNAKARGVIVDFLGKPASTFRGPALLHLDTGAPIVVAVDERLAADPRKHRVSMTFLPPHRPTADRVADVQAVTQLLSDAMSVQIRRNPAQYFWFHRRFGKGVGLAG
jgi:KDO2-lipid IV(A) lauroyltransferase